MKWHALEDKSGAYEIRRAAGEVIGGIIIDAKNLGSGFIGNVEDNRYFFELEEGVFSRCVKVYAGNRKNQIGVINLGFIYNGSLESSWGRYEWNSIGSSKTWTKDKNVVMFLDLENDTEKPVNILSSENLDPKYRELLLLSGWYLIVVEYRAGFTNSNLAGMPVKSEEFSKQTKRGANYADWCEAIVDAMID